MSKWAYDYTNEELVKAFMSACAHAGAASSGLVIDVTGPYQVEEAHYLKGVLLARLDQQAPPFRRKDCVKTRGGASVRSTDYWGRGVEGKEALTIYRIYYVGNGQWAVRFKEIEHHERSRPRYQAQDFELVESNQVKAALV